MLRCLVESDGGICLLLARAAAALPLAMHFFGKDDLALFLEKAYEWFDFGSKALLENEIGS